MSHTGVAKVTISLPRDLLAKVDTERRTEPRSTFIARTLGATLAGASSPAGGVRRSSPDGLADLRSAHADAAAHGAQLAAETLRLALERHGVRV